MNDLTLVQFLTILFIILLALIVIGYFVVEWVNKKNNVYRIIETDYSNDQLNSYLVQSYQAQFKVSGVWFNIVHFQASSNKPYLSLSEEHSFLSPQDCFDLINEFKSRGIKTLPSNNKLSKNQKAFIIE